MKYKVLTIRSTGSISEYVNELPLIGNKQYFDLKESGVSAVFVFEKAKKGWKAISKLTINSNGYVVDLYNV